MLARRTQRMVRGRIRQFMISACQQMLAAQLHQGGLGGDRCHASRSDGAARCATYDGIAQVWRRLRPQIFEYVSAGLVGEPYGAALDEHLEIGLALVHLEVRRAQAENGV